jgi:hypothetical protein
MTFILHTDGEPADHHELRRRFEAYNAYLESVRDRMSRSAYEFATAHWHYDPTDPRCPHDAWVEELMITEPSSGDRSEIREIAVTVKLLGAYHDGFIILEYENVFEYSLVSPSRVGALPGYSGHGDWLIDEITLTKDGHVRHEIEFSSGSVWVIVAEDIKYQWTGADPPKWPDHHIERS